MTNNIVSYKGREVNINEPVWIYRNLHSKDVSYSVRQKGLVVGHTNSLSVKDARFVVNQKGKERVQKEGRKNVHAFIRGMVDEGLTPVDKITYNPYKDIGFHFQASGTEVTNVDMVVINQTGVWRGER